MCVFAQPHCEDLPSLSGQNLVINISEVRRVIGQTRKGDSPLKMREWIVRFWVIVVGSKNASKVLHLWSETKSYSVYSETWDMVPGKDESRAWPGCVCGASDMLATVQCWDFIAQLRRFRWEQESAFFLSNSPKSKDIQFIMAEARRGEAAISR